MLEISTSVSGPFPVVLLQAPGRHGWLSGPLPLLGAFNIAFPPNHGCRVCSMTVLGLGLLDICLDPSIGQVLPQLWENALEPCKDLSLVLI